MARKKALILTLCIRCFSRQSAASFSRNASRCSICDAHFLAWGTASLTDIDLDYSTIYLILSELLICFKSYGCNLPFFSSCLCARLTALIAAFSVSPAVLSLSLSAGSNAVSGRMRKFARMLGPLVVTKSWSCSSQKTWEASPS